MGDTKAVTALLRTFTEEEIARTLDISPDTLADLAETIVKNPNSTIEPAHFRSDAPGRKAVAELGDERRANFVSALHMGATIGQGGMGLVRAATQRSLGRKVAVKTLRPDVKSEQATIRLLREAWVTGSLEHPNIVPVYDLGLDHDGSPVIVLKHIEGSPWSELIARPGADDPLEENLRILVQVCNAVSLAHAHGVIHRDLKPENVMVGRFGEVYLVDWGIAVSLRPDPTGRMPLASDAKEMAGTPAYMAPEMLGAMGALSERTDVYLLGAILHEILVGKPPHLGQVFPAIMASILLSKFEYPETVSPELAAIATRAMSRAQEDRFASAEELRLRIEWYLRHRGSLALSAEAAARVEEMRVVLQEGTDPEAVRDRVHHLFAEARFGFRQAIRTCDDNEGARAGLRRVTEMVVAFELEEGTPEAAAAALAELETPPPALAEQVAAAMRARAADKQRVAALERLGAEHDPESGRRTRMASAAMLGVIWTVAPMAVDRLYIPRQADLPYWTPYAMTAGLAFVITLVGRWGRESLTKTVVNRRMMATVAYVLGVQLTLQLGAHLLAIPALITWALHLFGWFAGAAAFAVLVDRRFWPSMVAFFVAFVYAASLPAHTFYAMSLSNFVLLLNFIVAWTRPRADGDYFVGQMKLRVDRRRRASASGGDSRRAR